jgi:hypothetical protein
VVREVGHAMGSFSEVSGVLRDLSKKQGGG